MADDRRTGVDWRRIATEFLVIVAGVMVALATDRWTSSLDDRGRERTHLEHLLADFRENEQVALGSASYKRNLAASAAAVLAAIKGTRDSTRTVPFPVDVELAGWNHAPHYFSEAWQDLLSTGDMRLLRNTELRTAIARFYQHVATSPEYEQEWRSYVMAYRASVSNVLDPDLRLRILDRFPDGLASRDSLDARVSDDGIAERLRARPDVPGTLTDAIMAHRAGAQTYATDAKMIQEIITNLERELGRTRGSQ